VGIRMCLNMALSFTKVGVSRSLIMETLGAKYKARAATFSGWADTGGEEGFSYTPGPRYGLK
jgi:hypothetical protein